MEDSKKSDDLPNQDSITDESLKIVSRDRVRSTPSYSAGPSSSADNSSVGPSHDKDISESLNSLNIAGAKSKSTSSSRGTFAAVPSLSTDSEPTPGSTANSTTCLLPPKTFMMAGDFLFKAYSPTPENSQVLPEDRSKPEPIIEQEFTESSFFIEANQGSQTESNICEPKPTQEQPQLEPSLIEEQPSPKKDVKVSPGKKAASPQEKRSPRPSRSPKANRSPKAGPSTKDGSSPKAGPSTKVEPSRRRSSDFSSSDDAAGVSPKKLKPRAAEKLQQAKEVDPVTAPIKPNHESTIEIKTRYGVLGLALLGGKDTAVNGAAAVVQDIYNDGIISKDGRLKIGDQIKECNEVQITKDMAYERIAMTIKQSTHKLRLVVYRPDPIPYKEIQVELRRKPGEPLGLTFRPPVSGQGVYIGDPMPYTPVHRDGRIKKGDILLSVDNKDLTTSDFLTVASILKLIGYKAIVKVRRYKIA